jgi:hypothetical protein
MGNVPYTNESSDYSVSRVLYGKNPDNARFLKIYGKRPDKTLTEGLIRKESNDLIVGASVLGWGSPQIASVEC